MLLLVLGPALDLQILDGERAEGGDEGRSQTSVGQQRDVEVNGRATQTVPVEDLQIKSWAEYK